MVEYVLYLDLLHRNRRIIDPLKEKSIDIFSLCIILEVTMICWLSAASGGLVLALKQLAQEKKEIFLRVEYNGIFSE